MDEFVVTTREQLAAAFIAGACETFSEAKKNPFRITFGRTVYTLKAGMQRANAERAARAAKRLPRVDAQLAVEALEGR